MSSEGVVTVQPGTEVIVAGVLNSAGKRHQVLRPVRLDEENFQLFCEWEGCSYETSSQENFMEHVSTHIPGVEISNQESDSDSIERKPLTLQVLLVCKWTCCPFKSRLSEDIQRHLYLHAFHTKLKCIGANTSRRASLNECLADNKTRNIIPDLAQNLQCSWGTCSEVFNNIQRYYDHIRYHCEDQRGQSSISCSWTGCSSTFANVTKLKDHMKSHSQEKMLACPKCGGLFSNRTRFFDHCRRQILVADELFACDVCMKVFSTARLLREHVRSHINTHRCPHCDMSCSSPAALANHVRYKHSTERPFQCPYCPFRAKVQSDVTKHCKVHEEVYLYCDEPGCSYRTKSAAYLQNHTDRIHGSVKTSNYTCHICEARYLKGSYLTKHLVSVHKLQWPAGHSRFRYTEGEDGLFRLNNTRLELGIVDMDTLTSQSHPFALNSEYVLEIKPSTTA